MDEYSRKDKKKHKKDKKKHKKDKKKKMKKYSSSESEEEWVEKKLDQHVEVKSSKRDEWMTLEEDFNIFSVKKENKTDKNKSELEINQPQKLGQSSRELNPYWRDGGDGLPPDIKKSSGSNEYYGRKIQEQEISNRNASKYSKYNAEIEFDKKNAYNEAECSYNKKYDKSGTERKSNAKFSSYCRERIEEGDRSKVNNFDSMKQEINRDKSLFSSKTFKKPKYDDDEFGRVSECEKHSEGKSTRATASSSKKRWQKDLNAGGSRSSPTEITSEPDVHHKSSNEIPLIKEEPPKILSRDELNKLCGRIIKAKMMGNMKLAEELQLQLDKAKKIIDTKTNYKDNKVREIIVLTETDSKGFTRPLKSIRDERLSKKRKTETHEGNKRVRYFADDDSQSLQEMFEKERFGSSREQNATFMKLMGKELSENNEDAFEETASLGNTSRQDRRNWNDAIRDNAKKEKALDNCFWCLDSKRMNQDVVVAIRNKVQLCVPSSYSLTEGHCIILPCDHITCATNLDEDVWEDVVSLRKTLVKIFEAEGEDVVFFECASNLDKYPHMQLHCVPVPKETGDVAPIYFKKAIMECEMEWSNNKKVVDLKGKNVRKAIPKGLPYFAVDFGMQPGYAHVIEDRQLFPNNFAQEVIGGMLDLDHLKWRKFHRDSVENIQKKATYLKNLLQKNV